MKEVGPDVVCTFLVVLLPTDFEAAGRADAGDADSDFLLRCAKRLTSKSLLVEKWPSTAASCRVSVWEEEEEEGWDTLGMERREAEAAEQAVTGGSTTFHVHCRWLLTKFTSILCGSSLEPVCKVSAM